MSAIPNGLAEALVAIRHGDVAPLISLLAPDVRWDSWKRSDGWRRGHWWWRYTPT